MKQAAAGAGLALFGSKTGNKELQQSGLDIYQNASREAEKFDDPSASLSNVVLDGKGNFSDFSKYWAGYGIGQVVESAITSLAKRGRWRRWALSCRAPAPQRHGVGICRRHHRQGRRQEGTCRGRREAAGKGGSGRHCSRAHARSRGGRRSPVVKTWVAAETKKAGVRALAAAGAASGLYAQNTGMELGEIYGHYIDEMVRTGRPITPEDEDLALKSAMAAAASKPWRTRWGLGRLLGGARTPPANGFVSNVAKEVALWNWP